MNRRDFLSAAAGAALAAAATAKDDPTMPPVVDTHQHLWDLTRIRLNWVKPDDPLNHSFAPKEYAEATRGPERRQGGVHGSTMSSPSQQQKKTDYVIKLCEDGEDADVAARGGLTGDRFGGLRGEGDAPAVQRATST